MLSLVLASSIGLECAPVSSCVGECVLVSVLGNDLFVALGGDSLSCLVLFPIYALGPWVRRSWHPCRVICLVRLFDVIGVPQPGHFTLDLRPVYLLVVISSFCSSRFLQVL